MLHHMHPDPHPPTRTVLLGARGFVAGAIAARLARAAAPLLALGSKDLDLLSDGAGAALAERLLPGDALVVVSALAPCKDAPTLVKNLEMVRGVCAALEQTQIAHVVYVSSDAVYGDCDAPLVESSCADAPSLHGAMHRARELMLQSLAADRLCLLRPSLLYGAADPHNGYGPNRFRRSARGEGRIGLFGDGEEQRDHVLIDDLAELTRLALEHRSAGVLNVATGESVSFRSAAERVAAHFDSPIEIAGSPRQNPITHRHFDPTATLKSFPEFRYTGLDRGLAQAHREMVGAGD